MKKLLFLSVAAIAALMVSCQVEAPFENTESASYHTVTVTVEKGLDTKTAIVENGAEASYIWTSGDESRFHIYENGVEATSMSMVLSDGDAVATFTATFPDRTASEYVYSALYAGAISDDGSAIIPATQRPEAASFDPRADVMVSASEIVSSGTPATSLQFRLLRQVSVNKMTLKGLASGEILQSVVLSSSDKEFVPGSDKLVLDFSGKNIATGSDIPVYFVCDAVENASFKIDVMTDKAIYHRDNFSSKLTFEPGTVRQFGLQLGSYRHPGGTQEYPWLIASTADMLAVSGRMIAEQTVYFKVVADIDMSGIEWIPLNNTSPYNQFINFDGGNHTISNLSPKSGEAYPSLFGVMYGSVKDLTLADFTINAGDKKGGAFAGYVGTSSNLTICSVENVTVKNATVSGSNYCGGFTAQIAAQGTLTDILVKGSTVTSSAARAGGLAAECSAAVTISGCAVEDCAVECNARYAGGMFGAFTSACTGTTENCRVKNTSVTCTADRVGGFIGELPAVSFLNNCYAENVSVVATINAGGLVGVGYGTITNCSSSGSVSSTNTTSNTDIALGGLVGYVDNNATITKCSSSVNINQTNNGRDIGGLVGKMLRGTIQQCSASGDVKGIQRNVGGLVGLVTLTSNTASIIDSYSTGTVTADSYNGGLIGMYEKGSLTVSNCYSSSAVDATGGFAAGGLIGVVSAANINMSNCAAWNSRVKPKNYGSGNWSSGAVVGVTFPTCTMTDNYRNPDMALTAYWVPAADYDHPNVSSTHPLVKQDGTETSATGTGSGQDGYPQFPYHGKHVSSGTSLSTLAATLGWGNDKWIFTGSLPVLKDCGVDENATGAPSNPWDANRGKVVTPSGTGWSHTTIAEGIEYYYFSGTDDVTGVVQQAFAVTLDLTKTQYAVRYSFSEDTDGAITSDVFSSTNAYAVINGGYELGSIFTRVNGYNWSVLRNDYIGETTVPNWKSEAAVYVDNTGRNVRISFDGRHRTLAQLRSFYRNNTWPNLISSAPMLVDNYEPVGESFVDSSLSQAELEALEYEDPNRHQGVRHPRTAVALTEDHRFIMFVVDGRNNYSKGMSAKELTKFLVKWFNPQYALNMDGGGSSTMCVRGQGASSTHVVNYPCDNNKHDHAGERAVRTHIYIGASE